MATRTFTGLGRPGDWSDPKNWKGDVAPGPTDRAQILGGPSSAVNGAVSVNAIMLIGGETVTFSGAVATAGVGNCQGFMVCINSTAVFAAGSSLADGGVLQIGVAGTGGFVADGTSALATTIHSKTGTIGKLAAGIGTVTIDHASWTTDAALLDGDFGKGTLNVLDGGHVTVGGRFAMGVESGAAGYATLSSGGVITVEGGASIGDAATGAPLGTASLTVNAGSLFDGQSWMHVSAGSAVHLAGGTVSTGDVSSGLTVMAGGQVTGYGTLVSRAGGWINDAGTIEAQGGTMQISQSVGGVGAILIDANSTVAITGHSLQTASLAFSGADATLTLAHAAMVKTNLTGFTFGDQIEMAGIDKAVWNGATQTLKLSSAGHPVDNLHLTGSFAGDVFSVTQSNGLGVVTLHAGP